MARLSASAVLAALTTVAAQATAPCVASYYSGITATTGPTLRSQLHDLIDAHNIIPYSTSAFGDAYDALENVDRILTSGGSPTNTVRTIYSFPRTADLQYDNGNGWNRCILTAPTSCTARSHLNQRLNACILAAQRAFVAKVARRRHDRSGHVRPPRPVRLCTPPHARSTTDPIELNIFLLTLSATTSRRAETGRERQLCAQQQTLLQLRILLRRWPCPPGGGPDCQRERGLLDATDRSTRRHRASAILHVRKHARHFRPKKRLRQTMHIVD
eukprot:5483111-Pleurochrysis_carterae.AAC.2